VRFVVDDVVLGVGLLPTLPFSPFSIITLMLCALLHLHVATIRKDKRAKSGDRPKGFCFVSQKELNRKAFKVFYGLERLNDATRSD
jgi:hypothetical protein